MAGGGKPPVTQSDGPRPPAAPKEPVSRKKNSRAQAEALRANLQRRKARERAGERAAQAASEKSDSEG
jgi:hypothetical protein